MITQSSKRRSREAGNVIVVTLGAVVILATIAATTLSAISSRYPTAYRTAAWEEALLSAESGVNMTIAQIAGLLPDIQLNNAGAVLAAPTPSPSLVTGLKLEAGGLNLNSVASISLTSDPLVHGGEGATTSTGTVSIDVLTLDTALNGQLLSGVVGLLDTSKAASVTLLRLRSKGVVELPSTSRVPDSSKLDARMIRAAFVRDPATGQTVSRPFVSREIEVLLKPVFPFERGVATEDLIEAISSPTVFDSFNSGSSTTSTNGLYDSSKRREKIEVASNSAQVTLGGVVHGDVFTNGSNLPKDSHVTGRVNNDYFRPLPAIKAPTWAASTSTVNGPLETSIVAGSLLSPSHNKYTDVTSTGILHVKASLLGGLLSLLDPINKQADIWVTGNFLGKLIVDPGVKVRLFVAGNVNFVSGALDNKTQRAANVQIFGLPSTTATAQTMTIDTSSNPIASIYAPTHALTLNGNGGFSGAISSANLRMTGNSGVHFDEALTLETGLLLGYGVVSWKEITPL